MPTPLATPDTVTGRVEPSCPGSCVRTVAHLVAKFAVRSASDDRGQGVLRVRQAVRDQPFQGRLDQVHAQRLHHPGRHRERVGRGYAGSATEHLGQSALLGHARLTRGGVGAAADREHGRGRGVSSCATSIHGREMSPAQQHRRRGEPVGRERGGHAASAPPSTSTTDRSGRPDFLTPAVAAPARNPRGSRAAASTDGRSDGSGWSRSMGPLTGSGSERSLLQPRRLGQAKDHVERLDGLARGALDQVIHDPTATYPTGPLVQ